MTVSVVANQVNRLRVRLELKRMTVGWSHFARYVISHPDQLSLTIPPRVGAMSISESWGVTKQTHRAMH